MVNANGPIYGSLEASADYVPVLDPISHTASEITVPVRDPETPRSGPPLQPSPYWGDEAIWDSQANVHNPMLDGEGRVWLTSRVRPSDNPPFCQEGSDHPSARLFPTERAGRHLAVYDPTSERMTLIGTCFGTHHLVFAEDDDDTLWTSGGGQVIGWLNTKMFLETGDEQASQGWTALILDTNGNGRRDAYVEPDQPVDPTKDKRIRNGYYGVAVSPVDGSIWGSSLGFPGAGPSARPGVEPAGDRLDGDLRAAVGELEGAGAGLLAARHGHRPQRRRLDAVGERTSGEFRPPQVCGLLNGPAATGQHCPEGWTLYPEPLPQLKGVTDNGSAEASYYTWVDQFDTFGLGRNVPINIGNQSEALLALKDGEWVVMRVPYPLGFYTKWMDGRIDDPDAGWKGKGLWATYGTRAPFHLEGGKGTTSKVVKFQLRPDPLAK